jgi:gamma-glutamyl hercynylcysteine S-oxide synthase
MSLAVDPGCLLAWCRVPAATFLRVADGPSGGPRRTVTLSAFAITPTPVTNAQFDAFVADGGYEHERWWTVLGWRHRRVLGWEPPGHLLDVDPDAPVTGVSWWEAMAFASWCGATLPSEAQWELAVQGCAELVPGVAEWCLDNAHPRRGPDPDPVDPVVRTSEPDPHVVRGGDVPPTTGRTALSAHLRRPSLGLRLARPAHDAG